MQDTTNLMSLLQKFHSMGGFLDPVTNESFPGTFLDFYQSTQRIQMIQINGTNVFFIFYVFLLFFIFVIYLCVYEKDCLFIFMSFVSYIQVSFHIKKHVTQK